MGRSWRWPPVRHHIAEHTSACARSPWTSHPRPGHVPLRRTWGPKQGTQLFLKYCDRAFNFSSLVRPEICWDPSVAGSSPATGALPD
ncbi:hypothetical protein PoB_006842800 [Plakobranchus ocellatus]|uniref:Uncharacterized protein n=1 Tax=Plakobranchus ocellatus TaxID=259542 RepID=A0AAV4DCF4_9GAST|nr:hypothetical protein PoB_006842800 [Plakobranchus ocellatus]